MNAALPAAATHATAAWDNPIGTDGFEFIEYAAPDPQAMVAAFAAEPVDESWRAQTVLTLPVFYSGYRVTRAEGLLFLGLYLAYGLHVVSFTTGMPLAGKLEHLMLFFVLPALVAFLLFSTLRAWRRQHKRESQ